MPVTVTSIAFDSIDTALAEIKAGRAIVVVDDENRENEGDLICAAQFATPDLINFMAVQARGLICLAMTGERLDALELPLMVTKNTDSNQTAFTVSIDAAPHLGVKTGISAEDRAKTVQVAINPVTRPDDLTRPGHVFPIRAKAGGVLKRAGHTEAAVDLARLAGLYPAGVICEIQNPDGSMARLPQLFEYARQHNLKLISIADLTMGQSPESEYYNEDRSGLPFHQGVTNFGIRFPENKVYCAKITRIANEGDILFSVRAPVGRMNISLEKIIIGRGLAAIRAKHNYQGFLYYHLKNYFFKEDMIGSGVIFASVTKAGLENVQLIKPKDSILAIFLDKTISIDEQIKILFRQNQKLKQARDILLPKLMNGEIEV